MKRVLIVDDHAENRYLLRVLMEGNGYVVDEACHGEEALTKARQHLPDLAISDLLMPVLDGYTLLRQWRADRRLKAVPFVVYTATYMEPRDERLALALGADAFIIKPAEPGPFITRIRDVLEKKARGEQASTVEPSLEEYALLKEYNEVLLRKLEKKVLEAEQTNRELREEIAERKRGEQNRKTLEDQLRQSQKMEAVGRLAGGVAHDFNNLLTIICGCSDLLLAVPEVSDVDREVVEAIRAAGEKAAVLTRQLLGFSRQTMSQPKILDVNAVVSETAKMLRRLLGGDIHLTTVLDPHLDRINVDPGQFDQVLMNLAVNARDAMTAGGTLTIETANVVLSDDYAASHLAFKAGPHVMLAFSDTGCGITPDVLAHVFEPFFTTKGVGKGTGLGLAMVFGIVQQSNGSIHVYSEPGHGTTFKIYFPVEEEPVPTTSGSRSHAELHGTETILLVEDEPGVRALASRSLSRHGYTVLAATDGQDALQVVRAHHGPLDLVLTDMVMPTLSGPELAAILRTQFPHLKVLFMSGYSSDAVVRHGLLDADVSFVQKPYTPLGLAEKVRQVLDNSRDTPPV